MPFTRRELLLGFGAAALSEITAARPASRSASQRVRLAKANDFGAIGDGRADATGALRQALASGQVIDGDGERYAIRGNLVARKGFKGLVNATLVETEPAGNKPRVLTIENADNFILEGLKIERGGTGGEDTDRRDIGKTGGIFLSKCNNFNIRGVEISGGGIGSGLAVIDSSDFVISDAHSHDIWYRLDKLPEDDAIQALFLVRCSNFKMQSCKASDIGGSVGLTASHDENRGFALSGCRNFVITGAEVRRLGQGIDITGSDGNSDFRIEGGIAEDCATYGFKFANTAQRGLIVATVARRCGIGGFIASGPAEPKIPPEHDLTFDRCRAEDVLGNYRKNGGFGFGILKQKVDPTYPRGVIFRNCIARVSHGHMDYGFRNDVPSAVTDGMPNRLIECEATGYAKGFQLGFNV